MRRRMKAKEAEAIDAPRLEDSSRKIVESLENRALISESGIRRSRRENAHFRLKNLLIYSENPHELQRENSC